jgi:hypothetical protein
MQKLTSESLPWKTKMEAASKKLGGLGVHLWMYPKKSRPPGTFSSSLCLGLQNQQGEETELSRFPLKNS